MRSIINENLSHITIDKKTMRNFGLIMAGGLTLIFGLAIPLLLSKELSAWPWILGSIFLFFAFFLPMQLRGIYVGWMAIGGILGFINTRIILSMMYFVIFTPVGSIYKILRKDPMTRALNKKIKTYRVTPISRDPKEHMEQPF